MIDFINRPGKANLTIIEKMAWFGQYVAIDYKNNNPIWNWNGVSYTLAGLQKKMHPLSLGVDYYYVCVK